MCGIAGIVDLTDNTAMYVFVVAVFLGVFLLIYRIINSPFGEVLKAIRENEPRAISLGYKTDRYKLVAFVLSATLAGLAGSTKALVVQIASLTDVNWPMSGEVVLMTLVGGLGTIFGPALGAVIIIAMTILPSLLLGGFNIIAVGIFLFVAIPAIYYQMR